MKYPMSLIAAAAVAGGAASASEWKTACARGGDERRIEIISPGEVGQMCDVRYSRDGGANVKTPYHANNSADFCAQKANELVQELASAGFACAPVSDAGLAQTPLSSERSSEAALSDPPSDYVVEARRAGEPSNAVRADAGDGVVDMAAAGQTAGDAQGGEDDLSARMNEILSQPARHAAVQGPEDLTERATERPAGAQPSSVVGRIVGAEPDLRPAGSGPQIATETTPAALRRNAAVETEDAAAASADAPPDRPASTGPSVVASLETSSGDKAKTPTLLRRPEEIVRATLNAQAAAWNEGDLEAFMEIYWKDDELKFVSGADVTKGWSATMKRYRERYAGGGGLGRLRFEAMDVEMVTQDVAVVTGRFQHAKDDQSSSGVFSLVMRRDEGVWRIVHDHTTTDAPAPQ